MYFPVFCPFNQPPPQLPQAEEMPFGVSHMLTYTLPIAFLNALNVWRSLFVLDPKQKLKQKKMKEMSSKKKTHLKLFKVQE